MPGCDAQSALSARTVANEGIIKLVMARKGSRDLTKSNSGIAMRLLIIEDDEKTAGALASGLERGGISTATAHNGEDDDLAKPFAFAELIR